MPIGAFFNNFCFAADFCCAAVHFWWRTSRRLARLYAVICGFAGLWLMGGTTLVDGAPGSKPDQPCRSPGCLAQPRRRPSVILSARPDGLSPTWGDDAPAEPALAAGDSGYAAQLSPEISALPGTDQRVFWTFRPSEAALISPVAGLRPCQREVKLAPHLGKRHPWAPRSCAGPACARWCCDRPSTCSAGCWASSARGFRVVPTRLPRRGQPAALGWLQEAQGLLASVHWNRAVQ